MPPRGLRWRGPAGIYGTTPWIVTCQPPPSCIGMRKRILDRYAESCTHAPNAGTRMHTHIREASALLPVCVVVRLGFRGSLARLSKSCLRDRSMSSLLCRGADRGAWRDPPCNRQNTHKGMDVEISNKLAKINRHCSKCWLYTIDTFVRLNSDVSEPILRMQ